MTIQFGDWSDGLFYITTSLPEGTVARQFPKLQEISKKIRKFEDGATVWRQGSQLNDLLLGLSYGNETNNHLVRTVHDYTFQRYKLQKNTGTDDAPVWVDLWYVDYSGNVTQAGGLTTGGDVTINGDLIMGGNIDVNGFYIHNIGSNIDVLETNAAKAVAFTNVSELDFVHNLGTKDILYNVYDNSRRTVIPEKLYTDTNQATFYFNPALTGRAIVSSGFANSVVRIRFGGNAYDTQRFAFNTNDFYYSQVNPGGQPEVNLQPIEKHTFSLQSAANDAAAATAGVLVGGLYHTSGTVKIRLV